MGRGNSKSSPSVVSMAGRYDLMPPPESERTAYGKLWVDHIRDVKAARLTMINILDAIEPDGLSIDDLRSRAITAGAPQDEIVVAQVQLIRQHVIAKDEGERWHISTSHNLVERWRELSSE